MAAVLQARVRHELHADADAEKGPARAAHRPLQRLHHAGQPVEPGAAVGEGAHPRQHDTRRRAHLRRIGAYRHLRPRRGQGLRGGTEVAGTVVDDDGLHVGALAGAAGVERAAQASEPPSTPLVEGTASGLRGSMATAARSARARPL